MKRTGSHKTGFEAGVLSQKPEVVSKSQKRQGMGSPLEPLERCANTFLLAR